MWIVRLALRRPYTFVVMALCILLGGIFTIARMPTDIFPEVDIPVIGVVWQYAGMMPEELANRVTSAYERTLTTTVNGIEHIESQTLLGTAVIKVFFHPGTQISEANAEVTAISQTLLKQFPPGTTPPLIMQYSASNVPVLQASVHSETLPEQPLFDLTSNFLRIGLATVQGAQMPFPFGGKVRQIMVDIDPERLQADGISPRDVIDAVNAQNLILPAGTAKLGTQEVYVKLNSSPTAVAEIANLPIKTVRGATITIGDVAHVRDGYAPQTSIVRADGRRGVLVSILKGAGASTIDIVKRVRAALPAALDTLPKEYKLDILLDQSLFVRAAVDGVVKEAVIAAALTGLMILLFLGSWRSTLIVVVSIPLSILVSIIVMASLGETLNLMTLGGLALAVGILVDDATVEIENVHRNIAMKKPIVKAILDGAQQIATPAFVATLCICIVFVPVVFIAGAAKSLFTPLAMAVVFAMLTSYFLSRTLVPTMVHYLLEPEVALYTGDPAGDALKKNFIWRTHEKFNVQFERLRRAYGGYLDWALDHRRLVVLAFLGFAARFHRCPTVFPFLGSDFFPAVDAGELRLHVRCPSGTRIEETERYFARVERVVREVIPPAELKTILDNIGIPASSINNVLGDPSMISSADGEMMISLDEEHHHAIAGYAKTLRERFAIEFPNLDIFFLAPDITTQVLNFGLSAPIDLQITGPPGNQPANLEIIRALRNEVAAVPGAVDVHLGQATGAPQLDVNVDRIEASQQGLTQQNVANDLLVSLSSSGQVSPSYWLDPKRGVQYLVAVQTLQYKVDSIEAIRNTPVRLTASTVPQTLGNLAHIQRTSSPVNITHFNAGGTYDVLANVQGADLGSVADAVDRLVQQTKKKLPRGSTLIMRGQVESMRSSFRGLGFGLIFAVALVYFLMVVNFQSWLDPLIILMALPGAIRRHRVDALRHRHHRQRAGADGRHHEHRRRHVELHPHGHVRQRSAT